MPLPAQEVLLLHANPTTVILCHLTSATALYICMHTHAKLNALKKKKKVSLGIVKIQLCYTKAENQIEVN